jgi:hypothetical protein
MTPSHTHGLPAALASEIHECGYFPELVADTVALALGDEPELAHLVHHEATFNRDEIQRHLSVLVLTPTRLVVSHTDENDEPDAPGQALTTTEAVSLRRVTSVALSQVVSHPEHPGARREIAEAWLAIGWGTMRRLDLEPAQCADPECEADHGYTGMATAEDLTVRISLAGDGAAKVRELVAFATALQLVTGKD